MTAAVTIAAPAKLTLSLRVTGVRDDGFHLIDAEMVTLTIGDVVTITPHGSGLSASGLFSAGMPLDDSNLVARALRLAGKNAAVHIDKQIPHGGGLGGGSADAAAVLRWAGFDDVVAASRLGADIAFCLVGGRARVEGIGEALTPLPPHDPPLPITLVVPPFGVSTPAVYRMWDDMGGPIGESGNDLEPAALAFEPRLVGWRDRIAAAAGHAPILAGSGATWFLHGHHPHLIEQLPDAHVLLTATSAA